MPGILCAIRGGPDSQHTIETAIALAKEKHLAIHFLYIVNLDFLTHTATSRTHSVNEEIEQMGEFILLAAGERAHRQDIEAEGMIRHGKVGEEIVAACVDIKADYVVLGRPAGQEGVNTFDMERLVKFGSYLEAETGAEVIYAGQKDAS